MPADLAEKTLLEELAEKRPQDVSGPQEAIKLTTRRIHIPEAPSRFFTSVADWHNSPG
jgi:hypothetical protein